MPAVFISVVEDHMELIFHSSLTVQERSALRKQCADDANVLVRVGQHGRVSRVVEGMHCRMRVGGAGLGPKRWGIGLVVI